MVKVTDLLKRFQDGRAAVTACDGISFEVPAGRFFTLLGPSGCGKTTTLRSIAGLERPDGGQIELDGAVVYSSRRGIFVPPNRRDVGMVFQSYAIWPHMTVFENVAFPLRVNRAHPRSQLADRVRQALATVRLDGLEQRPATRLSGGQQQRLALARALIREPKLLLLDEPMSNLDAKLREQMRLELRALQRQLGITTIYVTHDQVEALAMSNLVAVLHEGRIVQIGPPREIYERPATRFVSDFIGSTNFVPARVVSPAGGDLFHVLTSCGPLVCAIPDGAAVGREVAVSIRPEDVSIHTQPSDDAWEATVEQVIFLGESMDCRLSSGQVPLRARVHPSVRVRRGDRVFLTFHPERCTAVRPDGGVPA
ncbi:MAG TPA: ABC transporter ATP-binding protein [bacterium]|nr:ABC transporter ATP-binding protein [bacterium]